ncbi:MAG: outer membrane protein assembly factor BamA [Gammaproteobacteria bacterium]|nr:outer membrane protein assembly factor BamA [Gammaproteobacteria bacterium]
MKDIRLEGLQRTSVGTVFNYLPIKVGDTLNRDLSVRAIRSLYKTGFFKDVRLERENDVLVIFLAEKPAIASITLEGNSDISTDQLKDALKQIGLVEGRVFNRSLLDNIKIELQRQYFGLGKYGVNITTNITPLQRNRVDVDIRIAEGAKARVYELNIVGNQVFPTTKLLSQVELSGVSMFGGRQNYSKQVLTADIETIKSYYLDRGYINFSVDSTQVSITPDRQDVYITLNVTEGDQFTINKIKLAGELILDQKEMMSLLEIAEGEIFSRKNVSISRSKIITRMTEEGYAFANINIVPDIDKTRRTVELTVFVDPGRRVYVRRINISGNTKTRDEVIRRELRLFENSAFSTKLVADSQTRLNRLGFFESVNVETPAVPGANDLVDINYKVTERPTGSLSAGIGYSDQNGALFTFAVSQENFLGTGKRMGVNLSNSQVSDKYSIDYTDPYHTPEGISRRLSIYSENFDATELTATSNYTTNSYGASVHYGIPVSERQSLSIGAGYKTTELIPGGTPATEITDFITENGDAYSSYTVDLGWSFDSRNRAIFADEGNLYSVSAEYAMPGGDLEYSKVNLRYVQYLKLSDKSALMLNLLAGYGRGHGDTEKLPFFENFFVGGSRSVRGFRAGTLGPKDSLGNAIGGSSRFVGNLELVLPNPLSEQSSSTRFSLFYDVGQVFGDEPPYTRNELEFKKSVGVALLWLTPVGAMRFSLADPINAQPGDETQKFQFTLGSPF